MLPACAGRGDGRSGAGGRGARTLLPASRGGCEARCPHRSSSLQTLHPGDPPRTGSPGQGLGVSPALPTLQSGGVTGSGGCLQGAGGLQPLPCSPPACWGRQSPPPGGCRAKQRRAPAATPGGSGRAAGGEGWPRHENLWYEEAGDKPGREARERFLPGAGLAAACAAEPGPAGTPRPGRAAWKRPREGFWPLPGQGWGVRRPCCCLPPADASLPPRRRDILVSPPGCR